MKLTTKIPGKNKGFIQSWGEGGTGIHPQINMQISGVIFLITGGTHNTESNIPERERFF